MAEKRFQLALKYLFDKLFSLFLLLLLLPVWLVIAILIRLDSKGPVFFLQERIGKNGKPFVIYKFRTMEAAASATGGGEYVGESDPRITGIGLFLRKKSLDELPQLVNILTGEMSLIGPRPTLGFQVEKYDAFQRRRLEARPGVSNLPAVSGRNSLPWTERIKLDVWYIDHWNLWLDVRIFFKTIAVVFTGEGVYGSWENSVVDNDNSAAREQ